MFKKLVKVLCRLVVVATVVSAVLGVVYYFADRKNDYIEIYDDNYDEDYDDYDEEDSVVL